MALLKWVLWGTGLTGVFLLAGMVAASVIGQMHAGESLTAGLQMTRGRMAFRMVDLSTQVQFEISPPIAWRRDYGFSPNGQRALIFSASSDFQVQSFHIFDLHTQREIYTESTPGQKPGDIFILRRYGDYSPVWSPDSNRIAFRDPGGDGLYVIDLIAQTTTQIFETATVVIEDTAWSPDGQRIAFTANNDVYVIRYDGTGLYNLTEDLEPTYAPQWSPDGSRIAFFESQETIRRLYTYVTSPGPDHVLENVSEAIGDGYSPQWSPDGEWLVFYSGRIGMNEAYTVHLPTGEIYALNSHPGAELRDLKAVVWSPDSRRLAVEVLQEGSLSRTQIYVVTPDASEVFLLTADGKSPIWSPDSQRLVYTVPATPPTSNRRERRLKSALYVVRVEAPQTPVYLTEDGENLVWSADGQYVTLINYASRVNNQVLRINTTTGETEIVLDAEALITNYAYWRS